MKIKIEFSVNKRNIMPWRSEFSPKMIYREKGFVVVMSAHFK